MSRAGLEKFLYRFDKEPARQGLFEAGSDAVFDGFDLTDEEKKVLWAKDVATLFEWGLHPLLIRNYGAKVGVRYQEEYAARGITA